MNLNGFTDNIEAGYKSSMSRLKALSTESKIVTVMIVLAALSIAYALTQTKTVTGNFIVPPQMKWAAALPTVRVPIKSLTAIKPEALKKLKIPEALQNDPTRHVTRTATVPKSKGGYDILSVTDDNGDTEIITAEKPPALFSLENSGRVGVGYGLDSRHGQTAKVFAEYSPITILGGTVGVDAAIRFHPTSPDAPIAFYGGVVIFKQF